jgi:rhodanese-related sulfurtransferase
MAKVYKLGSLITIIILGLIFYIIYNQYSDNSNNLPSLKISVSEAKSRRFGLIIDVRSLKEREVLGYYPNSIPISIEKLKKEVPLDISSKDTHILIYSNGDNRSALAAEILYNMGYTNVRFISETYLSLMPGSS